MEKQVEELVLLLLHLTSWEEKIMNQKVKRTWKGYPFEILDDLIEKD